MPHSTPTAEDDNDLKLIQQALNPDPTNNLDDFLNPDRELILGDKADDAVDYEDIDLDDLPDEESATGEDLGDANILGDIGAGEDDGLTDLNDLVQDAGPPVHDGDEDPGFDLDDLFGDVPSSPVNGADADQGQPVPGEDSPDAERHQLQEPTNATAAGPSSAGRKETPSMTPAPVEDDTIDNELYARQMALFNELRTLPPAPETREEALAAMFPKYRKDQVPRFMELLPPRRLLYQGKTPLKIPKPVHPTKIALDLAPDQEKEFKTVATMDAKKRKTVHYGLVQVAEESSQSESVEDDFNIMDESDAEPVGGVTWRDLETVCQDWDIDLLDKSSDDGSDVFDEHPARRDDLFDDDDAEWDREFAIPPPKRIKLDRPISDILSQPIHSIPSFNDPEQATAKIARKIVLDLNDPKLLVDYNVHSPARESLDGHDAHGGPNRGRGKAMFRRYNISNDEAYDLLKENLQSKVRSTLGSLKMEHSMPALRLQYPYVCLLHPLLKDFIEYALM